MFGQVEKRMHLRLGAGVLTTTAAVVGVVVRGVWRRSPSCIHCDWHSSLAAFHLLLSDEKRIALQHLWTFTNCHVHRQRQLWNLPGWVDDEVLLLLAYDPHYRDRTLDDVQRNLCADCFVVVKNGINTVIVCSRWWRNGEGVSPDSA